MTFYLKYRPQKVNQLDLKDIREKLSQILSSKEIPHAFLFSGPKGLGKTSAARIMAKAVNCEMRKRRKGDMKETKRQDFEPCNKCAICKSITQGSCLDLIEIDAASNRGIDDIRELKAKIKLSPTRARKKVYVIDEVHMLTKEAFNALLKTLEEPPEHALFILCTTEAHKIPATIISRCLQVNFSLPTIEEITRSLERIVKGEKLKLEKGVLREISLHSNNSFRDAVKILEQLSFSDKKITLLKTQNFFGNGERLSKSILAYLADKDTTNALLWLNEEVKKGSDLKILAEAILESLRKFLLAKYGALDKKIDDYGFKIDQIKKLIILFDQAARELKEAVIPQLPLELAIIEYGEDKKGIKENIIPSKKSNNAAESDFILKKWTQALEKVKRENKQLEALLKSARPKEIKNGKLIVQVFYEFHKGKLELAENIKLIENKLKEIFKQSLKIKYILEPNKGGK